MSFKTFLGAAALLTATVAHAQTMDIPRRATVYSAEGAKVGRVDQVVKNSDGSTQSVKVIYRGRFVTIPAETLSMADKGLKTSLSNDALKRM